MFYGIIFCARYFLLSIMVLFAQDLKINKNVLNEDHTEVY